MGIAGDLVDCMRFHVFFFCEFQEMYWVFMGSCWDFMKILWDLLGITSMKHVQESWDVHPSKKFTYVYPITYVSYVYLNLSISICMYVCM